MTYILLFSFALFMALGQVLLKKGVLASGDSLFPGIINIWMFFAIILYVGSTLLWVWLLKQVPLSLAYPFAGLAFVIVPIGSYFVFGELLSVRYLVGCVVIILGIALTAT
ncbi:MAG: hypothetical protein ABJO09_09360 [Hyphomicrobiales bacterium]